MREIKFRAWHKALRQMYFDGWHGKCVGESGANSTNDHIRFLQNHDIELMQYTGLKDKNGVEIYEGDIVECVEKEMFNKRKNHIKFISPVFWDDLSWSLKESDKCDTALAVYDNTNPTKLPVTTIKVIGNIYENPELLKEAA